MSHSGTPNRPSGIPIKRNPLPATAMAQHTNTSGGNIVHGTNNEIRYSLDSHSDRYEDAETEGNDKNDAAAVARLSMDISRLTSLVPRRGGLFDVQIASNSPFGQSQDPSMGESLDDIDDIYNDNKEFLTQLIQSRGTELLYGKSGEILYHQLPQLTEVVIACDRYHFFVIADQRVYLKAHILDITCIQSTSTFDIALQFQHLILPAIPTENDDSEPDAENEAEDDDEETLVAHIHLEDTDGLLNALCTMWHTNFPMVPMDECPIQFIIQPESRIIQFIQEQSSLPFNGYLDSYIACCWHRNVPPRPHIISRIESFNDHFYLNHVPHLTPIDITILLQSLLYNSYFTRLSISMTMHSEALYAFLNLITISSSLTHIYASGIGLTEGVMQSWLSLNRKKSMSLSKNIIYLDLGNNPMDTSILCDLLTNNQSKSLKELHLSHIQATGQLLLSLPDSIIHLDLSGNPFDSEAAASLASFLSKEETHLEHLNLDKCEMNIDVLSDGLLSANSNCCHQLKTLNLAGGHLTRVEKFSAFLMKSTALNQLDLSQSDRMPQSHLLTALKSIAFQSLSPLRNIHLTLRSLNMTVEGVELLSVILSAETFTTLDLSDSLLSDEGLDILFSAFIHKKNHLRKLVLNGVFSQKRTILVDKRRSAIGSLCHLLKDNTVMTTFILKGFDGRGLNALINPIIYAAAKSRLKHLNVSFHHGKCGIALAYLLCHTTTLELLECDGNDFSMEDLDCIGEAIIGDNKIFTAIVLPIYDCFNIMKTSNGQLTVQRFIQLVELRNDRLIDQRNIQTAHELNKFYHDKEVEVEVEFMDELMTRHKVVIDRMMSSNVYHYLYDESGDLKEKIKCVLPILLSTREISHEEIETFTNQLHVKYTIFIMNELLHKLDIEHILSQPTTTNVADDSELCLMEYSENVLRQRLLFGYTLSYSSNNDQYEQCRMYCDVFMTFLYIHNISIKESIPVNDLMGIKRYDDDRFSIITKSYGILRFIALPNESPLWIAALNHLISGKMSSDPLANTTNDNEKDKDDKKNVSPKENDSCIDIEEKKAMALMEQAIKDDSNNSNNHSKKHSTDGDEEPVDSIVVNMDGKENEELFGKNSVDDNDSQRSDTVASNIIKLSVTELYSENSHQRLVDPSLLPSATEPTPTPLLLKNKSLAASYSALFNEQHGDSNSLSITATPTPALLHHRPNESSSSLSTDSFVTPLNKQKPATLTVPATIFYSAKDNKSEVTLSPFEEHLKTSTFITSLNDDLPPNSPLSSKMTTLMGEEVTSNLDDPIINKDSSFNDEKIGNTHVLPHLTRSRPKPQLKRNPSSHILPVTPLSSIAGSHHPAQTALLDYRLSLRKRPSVLHRNADAESEMRLFLIKGRYSIRVIQVKCHISSLSFDDAFVLDVPEKNLLYVYCGPQVNRIERGKAGKFATSYRHSVRKGLSRIIFMEEEEDALFYTLLGRTDVDKLIFDDRLSTMNDVIFEKQLRASFTLERADGGEEEEEDDIIMVGINGKTIEKPEGTADDSKTILDLIEGFSSDRDIVKEMLVSGNVYLLDCGTEMYIWEGKNAPRWKRTAVFQLAQRRMEKRPSWTLLLRTWENEEHLLFKLKFADWPEDTRVIDSSILMTPLKKENKVLSLIDIAKLLLLADKKKEKFIGYHSSYDRMIIDHEESAFLNVGYHIYIVDHYRLVDIVSPLGTFDSNNSYVILYGWQSKKDKKKRCALFFWQGRHCDINTKGAAALLCHHAWEQAVHSGYFHINPRFKRIVQMKETLDFKKICQGQYRIDHHSNNVTTECLVIDETDVNYWKSIYQQLLESPNLKDDIQLTNKLDFPMFYHIKPSVNEWELCAIQIPCQSSSLNSRDAFVFVSLEEKKYLWLGKGVLMDEKESLISFVERMNPLTIQMTVIEEGNEPVGFWGCFDGGKMDYANADYLSQMGQRRAKLFECHMATGEFKAEEIEQYCQDDLSVDYCYMLDAVFELYLWIGSNANDELCQQTTVLAQTFIKCQMEDNNSMVKPIYTHQAGKESLLFKCHFHGWTDQQ